MMTGMMLKSWKAVKQHIPLIKFRKGGRLYENSPPSADSAKNVTNTSKSSTSSTANQLPIIEDWQLPSQYRRSILDEKEIDAINSGGAY